MMMMMMMMMLISYIAQSNMRWIEFDKMRDQTATETIALLLKQFSLWGLSNEIDTDCGKNSDSKEFSQFCRSRLIKHTQILTPPSSEQWQRWINREDHQNLS